MPTRILRPGLTTSEHFNACDWFAQSLYIRILTLVDDFGRYDANERILKAHAFPLADDVQVPAIASGCQQLSANGLAKFYTVDGKKYLQLTRWQERVRSKESKFPPLADNCQQMPADCGQMPADASSCPLPTPYALRLTPCASVTPDSAHTPTWSEVKTLASMRAVPESSAKSFFDHHEGNCLWVNQYGRLINWQHKLTSWAANDRANPKRNSESTSSPIPTFEEQVPPMTKEEREAHRKKMLAKAMECHKPQTRTEGEE